MSFPKDNGVKIDWHPTLLHFQAAWGKNNRENSSGSRGACPTKNTFIEYPVLREPSLEEFLNERGSRSCPNSMNSCLQTLEQQFYPGLVWRRRGLEAFSEDVVPDERHPGERPLGAPAGPSNRRGSNMRGSPAGVPRGQEGTIPRWLDLESGLTRDLPVKNTFIEFPIVRNVSLDRFLKERQIRSCPPALDFTDRSTVASEEEFLPAPVMPPPMEEETGYLYYPGPNDETPRALGADEGLWDGEGVDEGPWDVDCGLENTLLNHGSLGHGNGRCKPCAFRWKDGCKTGLECPFCHLCPPGEVKRRKKDKLAWRKVARAFRNHAMNPSLFRRGYSQPSQQYGRQEMRQ